MPSNEAHSKSHKNETPTQFEQTITVKGKGIKTQHQLADTTIKSGDTSTAQPFKRKKDKIQLTNLRIQRRIDTARHRNDPRHEFPVRCSPRNLPGIGTRPIKRRNDIPLPYSLPSLCLQCK